MCPRPGTDDLDKRTSLTAAFRTLDGPALSLVSTLTMPSLQFPVPVTVDKKYHLESRHSGTQNVCKGVLFYEHVNEIRVVTGNESSRRSEIEHINVISVRTVSSKHTQKKKKQF